PESLRFERHDTVCIVGFDSPEFLDIDRFDQMRTKLARLIRETSCQTLIIDLEGFDCLTSGVFGFFATLIELGVEIQIANPSEQIQDILHTTKLNERIDICFDLDQFRK
ncbi:MAG: STAS domain-containing protein, partial [Planctomycetaceae bacterium]